MKLSTNRPVGFAVTGWVVSALCCTAFASEARADRVIASATEPTAVSAFGGRVVWSSYDSAQKLYYLMTHYRGRTVRLAVTPRPAPFDVDLGPDSHGRTAAVYSRCRHEPETGTASRGTFGDYSMARRCDLYEYSFASKHERHLALPGMQGTSEYLPTIWGKTIAFARRFDGRDGAEGAYPYLYYAQLARGHAKATPGGTRGAYDNFLGTYLGGPGPLGLDLRGRRIGFAWAASRHRCGNDEPRDDSVELEMWEGRLGSRARRLEDDCWGDNTLQRNDISDLVSPAFDGSRLWYYRQHFGGSKASRLRSYDVKTGKFRDRSINRNTLSIARDSGVTYYTRWNSPDATGVDIVRVAQTGK